MSGLEGVRAQVGRYLPPGLLAFWAATATWGTAGWAAKTLLAAGVAVVLTRSWPVAGLVAILFAELGTSILIGAFFLWLAFSDS